jgi:hypothetical protein
MGMYKFLSCEWLGEWNSLNIDEIAQIAAATQCHVCLMGGSYDENGFSIRILGLAYLALDDLIVFLQKSGFDKCRYWIAIPMEQFLKGHELDFSKKIKSGQSQSFLLFSTMFHG